MINFKKAEITDKQWVQELLRAADYPGSHHNFTNIFAWSGIFRTQIARVNDYLVVKGGKDPAQPVYSFPAGRGDLRAVIEEMKRDAADCGHRFRIFGLSPEDIQTLEGLYPGCFKYEANRDGYDYVYLLDKLVSLAGKKLQAKRNHINRFKANHPDWSLEEIAPANLDECWQMNVEWCKRNKCEDSIELTDELCAVARCFNNYDALGLEGALLRAEGRIVAFTMGEILNSNTYVIHVEKAFSEIQGAYQMINREFAALIKQRYPHIVYVNREEDMGFEGLRKAKLSYHPEILLEKYIAEYIA